VQITSFSTDRYTVRPWRSALSDPAARADLETALARILTPEVLAHLPPSLTLGPGDRVADWIDAREAESDVLTVTTARDGELIGLVILAQDPDAALPTVHLGYLFAKSVWGRGAASEVVTGLVQSLRASASIRLIGGVDPANPASTRVLEKAGFARDPALSSEDSTIYTKDLA